MTVVVVLRASTMAWMTLCLSRGGNSPRGDWCFGGEILTRVVGGHVSEASVPGGLCSHVSVLRHLGCASLRVS